MSTSNDLNAVLNQLMHENRTMRLLLLSVLRDKSVEDLNRYMKEASIRSQLETQGSQDQEYIQRIKKSELAAISTLNTLIAEKSASI
ncbi:hypothetical protein AAHD62_23775 [Enterobacter hormaechei]